MKNLEMWNFLIHGNYVTLFETLKRKFLGNCATLFYVTVLHYFRIISFILNFNST